MTFIIFKKQECFRSSAKIKFSLFWKGLLEEKVMLFWNWKESKNL